MIYIVLIAISFLSIFLIKTLTKITKIPAVLYLMLLGIILGEFGMYDFFGMLDKVNPNTSELALLANYAVVILFLISGIGLDLSNLKKIGKDALVLSTVPVFVEGIIMSLFAILLFSIVSIELFSFASINFFTVMFTFAMASPAIIIPITMKAKAEGKKSSILDQMTMASVVDNFAPMPFVIVFYIISLSLASGKAVNGLVITIVEVLVAMVVAYFIGYIVGRLSGLIKKIEFIPEKIVGLLLIFLTILLVIILGNFGASLGIIISFGIGIGFNVAVKDPVYKGKTLMNSSKIYQLFLMPLVFIYTGTQIRVDMLLDIKTIIMLAIITVVAIIIKGSVSKLYLKKRGYTVSEQNLSSSLFAAKGIILINLSLVLAAGFENVGLDNVLQYMYILAAVSIIISVPISLVGSSKILKNIK